MPAGVIRQSIVTVNGEAVVGPLTTVGAQLLDTVRDRSFSTLILTMLCVAGVAVTVAGLAGLVTFIVARRTREIAICIALGASRRHVRRLVVREALTSAAIGGIAGLLVGRWLSTWLESLVFGLRAGNWATTLEVGMLVLVFMLAAAVIPARRATSLQPIEALRIE